MNAKDVIPYTTTCLFTQPNLNQNGTDTILKQKTIDTERLQRKVLPLWWKRIQRNLHRREFLRNVSSGGTNTRIKTKKATSKNWIECSRKDK